MQGKQVLKMASDQVDGEGVVEERPQAQAGGQATMHRVASGQVLWLDVRAGQWLQVRAGAVTLQQDAGFATLEARWAMSWPTDETHSGRELLNGELMRVSAAGRCLVQAADEGDVLLVVWRPMSWWQRAMRRLLLREHQSAPRRSGEAVAKVSLPAEVQASV